MRASPPPSAALPLKLSKREVFLEALAGQPMLRDIVQSALKAAARGATNEGISSDGVHPEVSMRRSATVLLLWSLLVPTALVALKLFGAF